jgi:thermolysin
MTMKRVKRWWGILIFGFLVVLPVVAGATGQKDGFRALRGFEAQTFELPGDLRLWSSRPLARYGLRADHYRQCFGDAEVLGGQLTVYRKPGSEEKIVIGGHFFDLAPINKVGITAAKARSIAEDRLGKAGEWRVDLMLDPTTRLYFFRVENRRFDSRWFHWIDAETGAILNAYDGLAFGSGIGVLGNLKDLTGLTSPFRSSFFLLSQDRRQRTYDVKNRWLAFSLPGQIGRDADDYWNDTSWSSPGQSALVDAQYYARVADNYYLTVHGFNWTDDYPQGMVSSAHFRRNYSNAFWNGVQMVYGDGDGLSFLAMSGDLDVVAHELSHGVTEATSNLIYANESGALNEAFSDIMGTATEFYSGSGNWTIGEDIMLSGAGIRNMANPLEDGDPSHYADRYTGPSDNGGIHTNSGIANHWFYLLVQGGQNADPSRATGVDVGGIGLAAAERVVFLGFTALPANATFCNVREATLAVADPVDADNVADAWDEVGVTATLCSK